MEPSVIDKLEMHMELTDDECFDLSLEISKHINSADSSNQQTSRELIIKTLDNWARIPDASKAMLCDLIAAAGFYPYLAQMDALPDDLGEALRMSHHKSDFLADRFFHSEQKKIDSLIKSHVNVIVSAPTSFGKSMLIEEVVASGEYHNIVIIQPTLALLDETRRKLKKYSERYKLIVRTTQAPSTEKGNIFLLTAERVMEFPNMPQIQLLILDEFYKLSNKRGDYRNNTLNTAFVRIMKNPDCKFYLLGPNIDQIPEGFVKKYNAVFYQTDFSMVMTTEENMFENVQTQKGGKVAEPDLFSVLDGLGDQTLIFCSSPRIARKLAFSYCEHLISLGAAKKQELPLVDWISKNLSYRWSLSACLQYGIGVHDGAMPKHITSSTIHYFNERKIRYLFCTNTIIEGVNTSAKNVVYYDNKIGPRDVDFFDYSNIKGRAGRLMEHYVGKIINLRKPPEKEIMRVEFPFFEQNPVASEVLVNLEEADVVDINDNLTRYRAFQAKDPHLQEILRRNGVSIEGQEAILARLFTDLGDSERRRDIIWSQIDRNLSRRLTYIFDLCWETLSTADERKSFGSKARVINKIVDHCYNKTITQIIDSDIEYQAKQLAKSLGVPFESVDQIFSLVPQDMQAKADGIIEYIFAIQKNWFQYRAPKWINVVDSLQKYATQKMGLPSGDYSYVAEMIENEFVQSSLRILLEYGIPHSAVIKIQNIFKRNHVDAKRISEDDAIGLILRNKHILRKYLSEYEMDILERAI